MAFRSKKELEKGLRTLGVKSPKKLAKKLYRKQFAKLLPGHMINTIAATF